MIEEEKMTWNQLGWFRAGHFKAINDLIDFWIKYAPGLKEHRLNNYKGIIFVLEKLQEHKHEFFEHGCEIDLPFTIDELKNKKVKRKPE